ncbi:transient receptor potential channel pyrexia isoform X2 [Procambarus clarkii]|uniref:transient receptor potential channel pyrexia isoform X2 n=1 Tax=Procambarus clarkii TaxID=6728 RepID=UPI001E673BE7|nr:transient receptor potential channel pyrexia-like isoform X2 [Procambarus clarkii]
MFRYVSSILPWRGRKTSNFRISISNSGRWKSMHARGMHGVIEENLEEGEELDEVEVKPARGSNGGHATVAGRCSNGSMSMTAIDVCDSAPEDTCKAVHPLFSAIQRREVEEVEHLLVETPQATLEECGGLTPLHAATHVQDVAILKLLLDNSAQVEAVDGHGNTALHVAVSEGWHLGVAELLKAGASPDAKLMPPSTAVATKVGGTNKIQAEGDTPLQAAVRRGDVTTTKMLMQYRPDMSVVDKNGDSLLHLAAHAHSTELLSILLQHKVSSEMLHSRSYNGGGVMHAAIVKACDKVVEDTLLEILQMLFNTGVDVNLRNNQGESPLFLAACFRYSKAVERLLSMGADPLAVTQRGESVVHGACYKGCSSSLTHLLNTGRIDKLVTMPNVEGIEPFLYAIRSSSIDCCEILLNNGDHLTREDSEGVSRCALLLTYLPSAPDLLKRLFDARIHLSDEPQHDPNFRVTFDYSSILCQEKGEIQSSLMNDLNSSEAEALLKHPLIESFLGIKWSKIKLFFYSKIICFFIFLLLHTTYIVSTYKKTSKMSRALISLLVFRILHMFMYFVILWPELITIIGNPQKYLKHWETVTKFISLVSSAYVVFGHELLIKAVPGLETNIMNQTNSTPGTHLSVERQMAAVSVFFGWVELMMLCGRLPILGAHVLMFTRIAKSALKFIASFISLLIGFALSFMVLFYEKEEFGSFGRSLAKTLMMMVGELDYTGMVDSNTAYISYIVLMVFLFLVCVLMANLLIGLAVDDISNLERLGEIERLSKQASYLVTFEKLTGVVQRFRLFPRLATFLSNISKTNHKENVYVNRKRSSRWQCPRYQTPASTVQAAILTARANQTSRETSTEPCVAEYIAHTKKFEAKLEKIENMLKEAIRDTCKL